MDHSDHDRTRNEVRARSPNWLGGSSAHARRSFASFGPVYGSTGWLMQLAVLIAFCAAVAALGTTILREWRPGIFMPGSPLSSLSPLPPVSPQVVEAQASAPVLLRSPTVVNMELEAQARQKAQEEDERRRAAAAKQHAADEAAARRRAEIESRREREWRGAYVKPAHCDESLPNVDSIGCANDYIRARRKFDEQFTASTQR